MTEPNDSGAAQIPFEGDTRLREPIVAALKSTYDPEIPVDIYELGLIYGVKISEENICAVEMTLTSPACPAAESLPAEVKDRISAIEGIEGVNVEVVWDPPWSQEMMSEVARVTLGMF